MPTLECSAQNHSIVGSFQGQDAISPWCKMLFPKQKNKEEMNEPFSSSISVSSHSFIFDSRFKKDSDSSGSFRVTFRDLPLPFRHVQQFRVHNVLVSNAAVTNFSYLLLRIPELDGFEYPLMSNSSAGMRSYCTLIPDKVIGQFTRFDVLSPPHENGLASRQFPFQNFLTFELLDPATGEVISFGPSDYWMISGQYCTAQRRDP